MNHIKQAWNYLDGKKTIIASLLGLCLSWAQARGLISGDDAVFAASALTILTGVAVGHKFQKSK